MLPSSARAEHQYPTNNYRDDAYDGRNESFSLSGHTERTDLNGLTLLCVADSAKREDRRPGDYQENADNTKWSHGEILRSELRREMVIGGK